MTTPKRIGRLIGVLLLVQMTGGFTLNFVLLQPVFTAPGGYLVNAAPNSLQISLAALIGLVTGLISVGIAVAALPVFRRHSESMAYAFLALAVADFALAAVEHTTVLSLLSLSQAYTSASAADAAQFEALRGVVASARNWAHFVHLIVAGCAIFVLYGVLYRFVLVPRALATFGMLAALSQIAAVTMPLFGHAVIFLMIYPLGLAHLLLALWLLAKGFEERPQPAG